MPTAPSTSSPTGHGPATIGALSALALAAVHVIRVPWAAHLAPYLGVVLGADGVAFLALAVVLVRSATALVWIAGTATVLASASAYVLSRTVGLPGLPAQTADPLGDVALALEAVFAAAACAHVVVHVHHEHGARECRS